MSVPDWQEAIPSPPAGGGLHEAWFTTFDPPDAGLLVEYLLPSLLGAGHSLSQDLQERTLFFGELGTALQALHGRLTVISSPPRTERDAPQYPWVWRYVDHFTVGAESRAVQHAKLWAFHWKVDGEDHLELYVSSTNLTASAFKDQVQAGWRVTLPLASRSRPTVARTWGDLVPFLEALGASAGRVATTRLQRLVGLLGRAACPADVTFVASIPGHKGPARRLRQLEISKIRVLTPTIGEWNQQTLSDWSRDVGVDPSKIHLEWISTKHPWACCSGWSLSSASREALEASHVRLECLPNPAKLTEQHHEADPRWSHAKLYLLRSRRKRRLLVTSANWSVAAWGAGKLAPRNFELGVVFETEWSRLEEITERFTPPAAIPFCTDRINDDARTSALEWAEASWDGQRVELRARSCEPATPITATVSFLGSAQEHTALADGAAAMPWTDAMHTPLTARFIQGTQTLEVDVIDLRPPADFGDTPLPEVDPAVAAALREAFLLQRYGGPAVDAGSIPSMGTRAGAGAPAADYSVQAWLDAREGFGVVDRWRTTLAELTEAKADPAHIEQVRLDGEELRAIYARREGAAARLVAEELGWRLEEHI